MIMTVLGYLIGNKIDIQLNDNDEGNFVSYEKIDFVRDDILNIFVR